MLVIAVLAALVVGGYPWIDRHLPPGYRPFAPLSVDDPPTWVTRMKLKRIKRKRRWNHTVIGGMI
ncbi:hypothetical protein AAH678_20175 [Sodalis endosymbiont of Spalangia cameroni]